MGEAMQERATPPLAQRIEAMLMIADEPLSLTALGAVTGSPVSAVRDCVMMLQADYDGELGGSQRGFELRAIAGGFRLYVREELQPWVRAGMSQRPIQKLSQAALETLAVIAYQQPITRGGVAAIRAVNVDSVVRSLLSRELIAEVDRDPETGGARYGTTPELLRLLGIRSIQELPQISQMIEDHTADFTSEVG